jgi:hypothetical protein
MPLRAGPFSSSEIACALARLPGRQEIDRLEAFRIVDQLVSWWRRGEFGKDEIVVLIARKENSEPELCPFKEAVAEGHVTLDDFEWLAQRGFLMLTFDAAKRFIEASTVDAAPRVLHEWFTVAPSAPLTAPPDAAPLHDALAAERAVAGLPADTANRKPRSERQHPTDADLDAWMQQHVTRGTKRDGAIQACRDQMGPTHRAAAAAWDRLPDELKLKRGQRTTPTKIEQ